MTKKMCFVCLDPVSGGELWRLTYAAPGQLDYGNSPRATPLIADPVVYLLGAMGDLHCVDIDSGDVRWHKHLVKISAACCQYGAMVCHLC